MYHDIETEKGQLNNVGIDCHSNKKTRTRSTIYKYYIIVQIGQWLLTVTGKIWKTGWERIFSFSYRLQDSHTFVKIFKSSLKGAMNVTPYLALTFVHGQIFRIMNGNHPHRHNPLPPPRYVIKISVGWTLETITNNQ
jgi:hypothetical protein